MSAKYKCEGCGELFHRHELTHWKKRDWCRPCLCPDIPRDSLEDHAWRRKNQVVTGHDENKDIYGIYSDYLRAKKKIKAKDPELYRRIEKDWKTHSLNLHRPSPTKTWD